MSNNKPTIVLIHGGEVFATQKDFYEYLRQKACRINEEKKRRRSGLKTQLETEGREFIMPEMPAKQNADYTAREIRFERHLPFFSSHGVILIGYSLGGSFLAKRLSTHTLEKPLHQLHLVVAPFDNTNLHGEDLCDFQVDPKKLQEVSNQARQIHLYQSSDDPYVPWSHFEEYAAHFPTAHKHTFTDRNHFFQPEFPELLDCIYQRDR